MKKVTEKNDELRPEYDFSELKIVARGSARRNGNEIKLAPDVAKMFPTSDSVNEALRLLVRAAKRTKIEVGS